jgi:hypothetical protein
MAAAPVAAILALLLLAAPAPAATISADRAVTYRAGPGEVNRLVVSEDPAGLRFSDAGARIKASRPCRLKDRHTAVCPGGGGDDQIELFLGNRADHAQARFRYYTITMHGGPGGDRLTGGGGYDFLWGDHGRDVLRGEEGGDALHAGSGRDRIYGGPGSDVLFDDRSELPTSADLFDGGPNDSIRNGGPGDMVSYAGRRAPLDLDLARTPVNKSGEGDRLRGIESLAGGRGDDRIAGTSAPGYLEGGPGDDRLFGRGGSDILFGDPIGSAGNDTLSGGGARDVLWGEGGRDRLLGGSGGDLLIGLDTPSNGEPPDADVAADIAECGTGEDSLRGGPRDTARECEHAEGANLNVTVRPRIESGRAVFTARCGGFYGCRGEARLSSPKGADYGRVDFDLERDQSGEISVPLTGTGRSAFGAGGTFVAEFEVSDTRDIFGSPLVGYRTFMPAR